MARYLELAEEAMREIRTRRNLEKTGDGDLPWPGYNGGKQFSCDLCDAHFDTSVGFAKHQVNGCTSESSTPQQEPVQDLPSCPACGSFYLYTEPDGSLTCENCKLTLEQRSTYR